jgi:hypothetical protein
MATNAYTHAHIPSFHVLLAQRLRLCESPAKWVLTYLQNCVKSGGMECPMIQPVNIPYKEKVATYRPGAIASVGDFFTTTLHRALVALFFCPQMIKAGHRHSFCSSFWIHSGKPV